MFESNTNTMKTSISRHCWPCQPLVCREPLIDTLGVVLNGVFRKHASGIKSGWPLWWVFLTSFLQYFGMGPL